MRQEEPLCLSDSDDPLGNEDEEEEDDASYEGDQGDDQEDEDELDEDFEAVAAEARRVCRRAQAMRCVERVTARRPWERDSS